MIEQNDHIPFEKYVKFSVEELETLKESYIERINEKIDGHWLSKFGIEKQRKISKLVWIISTALITTGMTLVAGILIYVWIDRDSVIKHFELLIILLMTFMIGGGFMFHLLDDGTRKLRVELRNIDLILKKKKLQPTKEIMLDTNIIDDIINGALSRRDFSLAKKKGYKFYATHIQIDEINDCSDTEKRKKLNLFMSTIAPKVIPTESTIDGISRFGFSRLGDGEKYNKLKKSSIKSSKDALIGEVALKRNLILLSNDRQFRSSLRNEGGHAISIDDFKKIVNPKEKMR